MTLSPIIKCPGGKRQLAPTIIGLFPEQITYYAEPFFGGGAVFFALKDAGRLSSVREVTVCDANQHLMEMYESIRKDPKSLSQALDVIHGEYVKNPEKCYYEVRRLWNEKRYSAAKHLILRFGSFNGLWRENRSGGMNSPWGKHETLALPSLERLEEVSRALHGVHIEAHDFEDFFAVHAHLKTPGAVIYLDPPYVGSWNDYTRDGWTPTQMRRLIELAAEWTAAGCRVVMSHSDMPEVRAMIRDAWPSANVTEVMARRSISRNVDGRQPVAEILVHSSVVDNSTKVD